MIIAALSDILPPQAKAPIAMYMNNYYNIISQFSTFGNKKNSGSMNRAAVNIIDRRKLVM